MNDQVYEMQHNAIATALTKRVPSETAASSEDALLRSNANLTLRWIFSVVKSKIKHLLD